MTRREAIDRELVRYVARIEDARAAVTLDEYLKHRHRAHIHLMAMCRLKNGIVMRGSV